MARLDSKTLRLEDSFDLREGFPLIDIVSPWEVSDEEA